MTPTTEGSPDHQSNQAEDIVLGLNIVDELDEREPPDDTDDFKDPLGRTRRRLGISPETRTARILWTDREDRPAPKEPRAFVLGVGVALDDDWTLRGDPPPRPGLTLHNMPGNDGTLLQIWCTLLRLRIDNNPIAVERHAWPSPYEGEELWFGIARANNTQIAAMRRALPLFDTFAREAANSGGRKRLEDEPWPYWRKQADEAIKLRGQGYTWPDIFTRMKTPTRTLQRWVQRRQAEAENA